MSSHAYTEIFEKQNATDQSGRNLNVAMYHSHETNCDIHLFCKWVCMNAWSA